ncbi:MAG: hypothetical protein H7202_10250 [Pedobacter sp.]|nr:hypothetical protein [Pedobacter sp.]
MKHLKKLILTVAFASFLINLTIAQEAKTVILSDRSKVNYILNDSKLINGPYMVVNAENKLLLRGAYKDNKRIGNWYAFNTNGNVFLRYNYDSNKLLFLDTVSMSRIKVEIKSKDSEITEGASIPFPILSVDQYVSLLGTEFKRIILRENKNAFGTIDVDFIANVDERGKAYYEAVYIADNIPTSKKLIISEKSFDLQWLPANYKGNTLASVFSVKVRVDLSAVGVNLQRFNWNF